MTKTNAVHQSTTPATAKGETQHSEDAGDTRGVFFVAALNMSWQLAVVILVPVIGGVQLDKAVGTGSGGVWTFIGLGLALVGSALVMWRTVRLANKLPVPKLSAAQKRAIQKQYEEDDEDA